MRHAAGAVWRAVEIGCWGLGLSCLVVVAALRVSGQAASREAVAAFEAQAASAPIRSAEPDLALWSQKRIAAWRATFERKAPPALAILRIPSIALEVPVLPGTDDWTLDRAVGLIEDTSMPGAPGNAGIAGHRDGFFRALKDVGVGDTVEVSTTGGTSTYRIDKVWVVTPDDVSVLDPTPVPSITLVTCYPFYFIGPAPQRYIVRASRVDVSATR